MGVLTRERRWRTPKRQRPDEKRRSHGRLVLLHVMILAIFGILGVQLFRLQILNGDKYEVRAEQNRLRVVQIPTQRGLIYDRHGQPLVENVPSFTVTLVPADVPEERRDAVYGTLERLLGVPQGDIARQVALREAAGDPFSPIKLKTDVDRPTIFSLRELRSDLPGVDVKVETSRRYTGGSVMSHILGYVAPISAEQYAELSDEGYDINDHIGKTGVELTYEEVLRGRPGTKEVEIDATGREIQALSEDPPVAGSNVVLSIDLDLQREVDRILRESMGDSGTASAIIMDVNTGEILSMVSVPSYDNNVFTQEGSGEQIQQLLTDESKPLLNHAIGDNYAPGSTFKVITGAAALQEGIATVDTRIYGGGIMYVSNDTDPSIVTPFYDWQNFNYQMDFFQGFGNSSDIYFYCLAGACHDEMRNQDGLGVDRLARYARDFGLGEPTGIDLPGEAEGLVPDPEWKEDYFRAVNPDSKPWDRQWVKADTYFFGIGQGFVTTTPLQMVRVAATIANGGKLLEPTVVQEIRDQEGNVISDPGAEVQRQVSVSPENLAIMRQAMRYAVTNGTANKAAVPGVPVAGKTGTAEFGDATYVDGRAQYQEHGWFIGFAPYDDPQIAIVVFLHEGGGGADAAPAAQRILQQYFTMYPAARTVQAENGG